MRSIGIIFAACFLSLNSFNVQAQTALSSFDVPAAAHHTQVKLFLSADIAKPGVPFLAGTYDERMYEELRLRAQTFEVLTGGEFAADHADGQEEPVSASGEKLGSAVLPLPPPMIDHLRVKLQVWDAPSAPATPSNHP